MGEGVSFQQVDVFTQNPFKGNPVAVVLDGNDVSTEKMQQIAKWTNISETTFVCEPTDPRADYRLRIFTPNSELPFAGHPTLGSAHAVLKQGIKPKQSGQLMQESKVGLVPIDMEEEQLFFTLPEPKTRLLEEGIILELTDALGINVKDVKASRLIDIGAVWMTLQLSSAAMVLNLQPNLEKIATLTPADVTGVTVFGATGGNAKSSFEVRSFAPSEGVDEDPVCGSGNGCVAILVKELNLIEASRYIASQGSCVGRDGRIDVRFGENNQILIGGEAVTCISGKIHI